MISIFRKSLFTGLSLLLFVGFQVSAHEPVTNKAKKNTAKIHASKSRNTEPAKIGFSKPSTNIPVLDIFNDRELAYINSRPKITVCNVMQQASENASFNIVKLIANKSGLVFRSSPLLTWAEGLKGLQEGKCDILPWATKSEERAKVMNFTRPYVRIKRVVISKQNELYYRDLDEMSGKIFVMLKDNYAITQIRQKYPNMQFIYAGTISEELDHIYQGKAFGTIVSLYSAANLFNDEHQKKLKVVSVLPPAYDDIASLATRKEDSVLHDILEKSLIATNPRQIDEFMTQGTVVSYKPDVDYSRYWWIILAAAGTLSILVWWVRYLRNLNLQLTESKIQLERLSETDPLTQAFNRLKMDDVFTREIQNSTRYYFPLSIIMLDIDHFKSINDNFGHTVGDNVLVKMVELVKSKLRANDYLGRWGGEEFLIICPSTNLNNAIFVAEKIRSSIESEKFESIKQLTASLGVAEWKVGENQESLISRADSALYRSKNEGRNKLSY